MLKLFSSRLIYKIVEVRIFQIMILLIVLYWCDTSSLAIREEYGLKVFENRVLRRIFGPKGDEMARG
jgi:hypothetical protein